MCGPSDSATLLSPRRGNIHVTVLLEIPLQVVKFLIAQMITKNLLAAE